MSGSYLDIVALLALVVFLALRLRSVLGTKNEKQDKRVDPSDEQIKKVNGAFLKIPFFKSDDKHQIKGSGEVYTRPLTNPHDEILRRIRAIDSKFDMEGFMDGSKIAFRMIVEAFIKDDQSVLGTLLDESVYKQFSEVLANRRSAGECNRSELLELISANLVGADIKDSLVRLSVRFISRQRILITDMTGAVIEGHPERMEQLVDEWEFMRDFKSPNPNWLLVATRSYEEDIVV